MTAWILRTYEPTDLPVILALENSWRDHPLTLEELPRRIEQRQQVGAYQRLVAIKDDEIIGVGWTGASFTRKGFYDIQAIAGEACRGQGVGHALYTALERFAREAGAIGLEGVLRDDRPDWMAWAKRQGFAYRTQFFRSVLPLDGFDSTPFRGALEKATAAGYTFKSMAELPEEEAQRAYYAIDCEGVADEPDWVPGWQATPWELYREQNFTGPSYHPAGLLFALKDGEYAAVSGLNGLKDGGMHTNYSGVRRAHRGYGLAQALKLLAVEHAIAQGATEISTHNNALNGPMLAVNRKFGFLPQPGLFVIEKKL